MKAILSDVHGNLEALRAVLEDIDRMNVSEVYCLGDTVGYGPEPGPCLDLVRCHCQVALLGNHEQAALYHPAVPPRFSPAAARAISWTAQQLQVSGHAEDFRRLAELPVRHEEGETLFVHASPSDPLHQYVLPEDGRDVRKMWDLFAAVRYCCFHGHTHRPGVFTECLEFRTPRALDGVYRPGERKALVNVGSVGQPRDGDPRASYALFDGEVVRFRRVQYDVEATVGKIRAVPELDNILGERLRWGR